LLHNHPHLSSGAGTIGQKWPQYKGLSSTPLAIKKYLSTHTVNSLTFIISKISGDTILFIYNLFRKTHYED
jgi:hypothetical protein